MLDQPSFEQAVEKLASARKISCFTGAGISVECGIPAFRDTGGLWSKYPPEQFAHWKGLVKIAKKNPDKIVDFLLDVLKPIAKAKPGKAHHAIAQLERYRPVTILTQNVDQLHQEAGSTKVREIHGSFFKIVSMDKKDMGFPLKELTREDLFKALESLEKAKKGILKIPKLLLAMRSMFGLSVWGFYRPNIVLFGEMMAEPDWTIAQEDARKSDVMLVIGTSGSVYPAAILPEITQMSGGCVIQVDPHTPGGHLWLQGKAQDLLPKLVQEAFGS